MHSHRITALPLDEERLSADLAVSEGFVYNDSYADFVSTGLLRSTMLWNQSGSLDEASLGDYEGSARLTPHGEALPYVRELIGRLFDVRYLKYARFMRLAPGSVYVPHRDFLELKSDMVRVHLPLQTDDTVFASEENTVFRMRLGELWRLDATRTHSVGSFSDRDRVHIVCDFIADSLEQVLALDTPAEQELPEGNVAVRPPLTEQARRSLLGLAEVLDEHNYQEIQTLLIKQHFRTAISGDEVFELLKGIAAGSGRADLLHRATAHEEYCMVNR
ncbi:aspartyl/asparaginyl beta-hydroxylase domain-containing protein [Streptomyces murinus]|uniref:aspartyl/asparaginyl beta-hydroxylase domain-containing protein n=1 Tax=Streptomyces murinus TaxID=33900 RepID=UPI000A1F15E3|nr:aspartyl/asparaginyl beta-hydroxylase domain-containing protein [Streptomyces murinus]WDO05104.1 aspartyl/asparaginyl beta-hydroxylase domain-containing protein [Streptomyces murinus]